MAAAAWTALVLVSIHPAVHDGHGDVAAMPLPAALGWWAAMVTATMLPWTTADARWLALRTLPATRQQAIAAFALAFLAVWTAAGAAVLLALAPMRGEHAAVAVALAAAAAWQVAPARRRMLRRCAVSRAPSVRGVRARVDWTRAGALAGARCVTTCWAVMLPMAILHSPVLMLGAALVVASERRPAPNPERRGGRPAEALALLAGAAGFAAYAILS